MFKENETDERLNETRMRRFQYLCISFIHIFISDYSYAIENTTSIDDFFEKIDRSFKDVTGLAIISTKSPTTVTVPPPAPPPPIFTLYSSLLFVDGDSRTQAFLDTFSNDFQRNLVRTQLYTCPFTPLCGYRLDVVILDEEFRCCGPCSCNITECGPTGTCCPDILNEEYIMEYESTGKECIGLIIGNSFLQKTDGIIGNAGCKDTNDKELVKNCTRTYSVGMSIYDVLPCFENESSIVYRNKYCALCSGKYEADLSYFQAKIYTNSIPRSHISVNNAIEKVLTQDEFFLQFIPNGIENSSFSTCISYVDECNATGKWEKFDESIERACALYESEARSSEISYKNPFCAICNGDNVTRVFCNSGKDIILDGFSGLLRLNVNPKSTKHFNDYHCELEQYFDDLHKECKDVTCSALHYLQAGNCIPSFDTVSNEVYVLYLRVMPKAYLGLGTALQYTDDIVLAILGGHRELAKDYFCFIQSVYSISNASIYDNTIAYETEVLFVETHLSLNSSLISKTLYEMIETLIDFFHNKVITIHTASSELEFKVKVVEHNSAIFNASGIFDTNASTICDGEFDNFETTSVPDMTLSEDIYYFLRSNMCTAEIRTISEVLLDWDPIYIHPLTNCPKVKLNSSALSPRKNLDGSLTVSNKFIFDSIMYYTPSLNPYEPKKDGIYVCLDEYKKYIDVFRRSLVQQPLETTRFPIKAVVSSICSGLSIVALSLTLLVFSFLPSLRKTLPGKNNFALATFMSMAQILFLVASVGGVKKNSLLCKVLGFLLHMFWLLTIYWMNICTYHMFRVLSMSKLVPQSEPKRQFILYNIYAFIAMSVFVSINIAFSMLKYGTTGYGRMNCYISYQEAVLFTFALPTAIVILSNLGMFGYLTLKIILTPNITKHVQNEHNDIVIFVKLSTITGITWIFGVVNVWLEFDVLDYLFTVLNASQGVFIFLAFVMNKRVKGLLKQKFNLPPT